MKTSYLFPHRFKLASGILFAISCFLLIYALADDSAWSHFDINIKVPAIYQDWPDKGFFKWIDNNIFDEIVLSIFVLSGLIFAFSKEKVEDEMTAKIRLDSLAWATYANYLTFFAGVWLCYGFIIYSVMIVAFFTHLVFFILRFNWMIYKFKHADNEE